MRKSLVSIVAVLSLVFVAACGGDDDPTFDAPIGGGPDAPAGGEPDADTGGDPDAAPVPMPSAANLGQICDPAAPTCPMDYVCLSVAAGEPGFCSIECGGGMDMTTCGTANGFPGPGTGMCVLTATVDGVMTPFCGVACGVELGGDGMCPTDMTCGDLNMNGMTDLCLP